MPDATNGIIAVIHKSVLRQISAIPQTSLPFDRNQWL
jgi:hypothetical protein